MPIITVEEAVLAGGFGSAVIEFYNENDLTMLPIQRMGIPDHVY